MNKPRLQEYYEATVRSALAPYPEALAALTRALGGDLRPPG